MYAWYMPMKCMSMRYAPMASICPESSRAPSASTAPSRLEESEGRSKRKRRHTDRYEEGVEDGELPESQHGAIDQRGWIRICDW